MLLMQIVPVHRHANDFWPVRVQLMKTLLTGCESTEELISAFPAASVGVRSLGNPLNRFRLTILIN